MKIALYHNLPSGGAKRAIFETVQRLVKHHAVDIYTLSTANHDFCDLRPFVGKYEIFEFQPSPLLSSPWGRLNQVQRWRDLQRLERLGQQIAAKIDSQAYDLVYVHPSMWIQAPTVLTYLQTPTVYHIHESLRLIHEPKIPRPYLKNGWQGKLDKIDPLINLHRSRLAKLDWCNTRQATSLLANSHFTASNVQSAYGRRADVAYFGADSQIFHPIEQTKKENFVLSVGEIRPSKGFDFLIESIAQIPRANRPTLWIIGNASNQQEYSYLIDLARQNQVELKVEVMVDLNTLICRYNQAQLLVYAPIREPFGLVPLEAMACATPVIGVAEGGVLETIVDGVTGYLVERNPAKFAEAIGSLLDNPQLCKQYGQQGRAHILENWSWDKSTTKIEQYLHNVAVSS